MDITANEARRLTNESIADSEEFNELVEIVNREIRYTASQGGTRTIVPLASRPKYVDALSRKYVQLGYIVKEHYGHDADITICW